MRKLMHLAMVAALGLLLAGCWQSVTQPYRNVTSLTPFKAGVVTAMNVDGKTIHYALAKIARGRYRLTQTDKGQDFGEGFELGFFALPGAPADVLVYQAASLDHPAKADMLRYYGLVQLRNDGAAEIRPDCDKDAKAAKASGTVVGKDGACSFKTRAALETSLLALWKSAKKPGTVYTLR